MTPTPRTLYVHDDLTGAVAGDAEALRLAQALMALVARDVTRVRVLSLAEQVDALAASGDVPPFAMTIGIGGAGAAVARVVHARTGWFPMVRGVEVTREETDAGGYDLSTLGAGTLDVQLKPTEHAASLAVVDDTIFSGLTMRAVLGALPASVLDRTHAFCLRAVAESLPTIAALCPVRAAVAAPGRLLHDVSFINASGLVRPGAIRRAGRAPLAFFERPEWMRAWFPTDGDVIIAHCRELARVLVPRC